MKRFTETDKWAKDKWFGELEPRYKLFWLYLIDNCDNVGVWEVNLRVANLLIGYAYPMDTLLEAFKGKIHVFDSGEKWWIRSFVDFQHGILDPESLSKPILSYFKLLEKHSLYKEYTKGIHTLQGKGKGKGKGKGDSKEGGYPEDFSEWWGIYRKGNKTAAFKRWKETKSEHPQTLRAITNQYLDYCKRTERKVLDGAGFLSGKAWETEWTEEAQGGHEKPNLNGLPQTDPDGRKKVAIDMAEVWRDKNVGYDENGRKIQEPQQQRQ
tara:strand:+ start:5509 stop:6309 length:801 start_codon:yes stop_codon:yes gene_type:complete